MSKVTVFFVLIISINLFKSIIFEPDSLPKNSEVIVKPGMSLNEITDLLSTEKIINNPFFFKLWIKSNFLEKKIKFGEFFFNGNDSIYDISKKLVEGDFTFRQLTIVEGTYKYNLLEKLKKIDPNSNLKYEDIPNNIIADTYNYQATDTADRILKEIKKISDEFANKTWSMRDQSIPLRNLDEVFILASVVEMETSLSHEKPIISGVFFNRLNKKMRLQSDPTVLFSITKGKSKLERQLTRKDLKYKSPYNTYRIKGLPPSIICFPGRDSVVSVTQPLKSDLLYFVAKNYNGEHYFSSSYKEHLRNVEAARNEKK